MRCRVVNTCISNMANVEENTELNVEETRESGQEDAVNRKKHFRWDKDNKVENLIRCLANYKSQLEFQNSDFEADRVKQYFWNFPRKLSPG